MSDEHRRAARFVAWACVGAGGCLAVLTVLTIGPYLLVAVAVAAVLLARRSGATSELAGLLPGVGVIPLYVAWSNRAGPGTVCSVDAQGAQECVETWNPWPWLVLGLVLVVAGAILYSSLRRQRRAPGVRTST